MPNDPAPRLQCDLVMRGGITSGIVYPRAIAKLAETYDFRSIGGTSAGAIAAAATAAAAYGAKKGRDTFQDRIKNLPKKLGEDRDGKSVLERLFQPQAGTRRLFRVLMAALERERAAQKAAKVMTTLLANYWGYALTGAAILLLPLLLVAFALGLGLAPQVALIVASLIASFILALLAAAIGVGFDVFYRLPDNRCGLCSGSSNEKPDAAGVVPLTDWLHQLFQEVAGKQNGDNL